MSSATPRDLRAPGSSGTSGRWRRALLCVSAAAGGGYLRLLRGSRGSRRAPPAGGAEGAGAGPRGWRRATRGSGSRRRRRGSCAAAATASGAARGSFTLASLSSPVVGWHMACWLGSGGGDGRGLRPGGSVGAPPGAGSRVRAPIRPSFCELFSFSFLFFFFFFSRKAKKRKERREEEWSYCAA